MGLRVTILSGFLGAGKTTLLKRLLKAADKERIGVLLNEVGDAGIDTGIDAQRAFKELAEACACCVRSSDFERALQELIDRRDLDRVIFETTGLADPLPIIWRLEAIAGVALDGVITVLDPTGGETYDKDEWKAQVQAADWLVVAKRDLVSDTSALEAAVKTVAKDARFIDPEALTAALFSGDLDLREKERPAFALPRHSRFEGFVVSRKEAFDGAAVEAWFEALPKEVYRAKAIVRLKETWLAVHRVAQRMHTEPDAAPPAHGESRFAFFGEGLDRRSIENALAALATSV
ncbi:MAG: GTP-binding protein [Deltaproteobacteria bacterium]|nr:GTP-binding protein [Deltaproteobacteria bacterium]